MRRAWALALLLPACFEHKIRLEEQTVVELVPIGERTAATPLARITVADYKAEIARLRFEREETLYAKSMPPELKALALDQLVERRLLAMEAASLGIKASTTAVSKELLAMKGAFTQKEFEQLLIDTFQTEADLRRSLEERITQLMVLETQAFNRLKVDEADVQKAWAEKPAEEKIRPERIRARQIVVRTEDEGQKVQQELAKKGADFGEIAKRVSIAPEAEKGGDLGWFERGQMPTIFEEACFPLQPLQVSLLIPSEYGFHLCQLLEREPERPLGYEEVRAGLERQIRTDRMRTAQTEYLTTLRSRFNVVKDEAVLATLDKETP